jgi:hypothetical protein
MEHPKLTENMLVERVMSRLGSTNEDTRTIVRLAVGITIGHFLDILMDLENPESIKNKCYE